jgi:hypothetical protein
MWIKQLVSQLQENEITQPLFRKQLTALAREMLWLLLHLLSES